MNNVRTLDKSKPYGEVSGAGFNYKYEQDGRYFDYNGYEVQPKETAVGADTIKNAQDQAITIVSQAQAQAAAIIEAAKATAIREAKEAAGAAVREEVQRALAEQKAGAAGGRK